MKTVITSVLLVVAVVVGAVFFLDIDVLGKENQKETSAADLAELSMDTDIITTNLASANNFAVVQFNILLDSEKAKEELELRTPEVKEAIISSVASFTKDELIGEKGIQKLVNKLEKKLAKSLETGEIERILVTEYKLQ